ncbi:MAG TPA: hypothetical protein VFR23_14280 [Jiangellaceae bacterium]|nr:hypothetical protein [Jiangellaceae bacterium]
MGKKTKKTTEWVPAVLVPITVAVLGLVGVVIAAFISSWGDSETDKSADQTPTNHGPSSVRVISWESREVPPPPQVELVFKGKATEVLDQHYVFILVRLGDADNELSENAAMLSPKGHNYVVSPPAQWGADNTWTVTWQLPRLPESAYYTAVLAEVPAMGGSDLPNPLDELRAELGVAGPKSWTVKAEEEIDIAQTP